MKNDIFEGLGRSHVWAWDMPISLTLNQTHKHQEVFPSNTLVSFSGEKGIPHQLFRGKKRKETIHSQESLIFVDRGK